MDNKIEKSETEIREDFVRRLKLMALVDGAIDKAISEGLLEPCSVRVERNGKFYIERGYRISDERVYEDLMRLTYGAEEVRLKD